MSNVSTLNDWSKPAAAAIPKEGYFTLEQGRYGPTYPRTPACHGFTIIAKIKPGTEDEIRAYGKKIEERSPRAHTRSRRCSSITCDGCCSTSVRTSTSCTRAFDTDFDEYTEDAVQLFKATGVDTVFEKLEGFPADWKTNAQRSSSSCASTSVRVSSSTAIPLRISRRNQEGARIEAGVFVDARPDAVNAPRQEWIPRCWNWTTSNIS